MVDKHYLVFGDISTLDYDCGVSGIDSYKAAERVYEEVEIDGRNGTLLIDSGRYANIDIPYHIIFADSDVMQEFRSAILSQTGYQRLEDTHHPDEYRIAAIKGVFEPSMVGPENQSAVVTITFNCKPQRFLTSGETAITYTTDSSIHNPTYMDALPLVRVYGSGTVGIGTTAFTIAKHTRSYIDIDCDMQDCYFGSVNMNSYVTMSSGSFPILKKGDNGISLGSGITGIQITPRWWKL